MSGGDRLSDRRGLETLKHLSSQQWLVSARWLQRADKGSNKGETASITNDAILQMLAVQNGGEKPGMCARSAIGRKKGTYCTDKRQAGTSRAFRKGVVAQICSPLALPLSFSPYHLLLFLLLLLLTTTTARCWLDQCTLPWQPRSGRSRGGGGGASRDRASLFPDWSEAGVVGVGCRVGNDVT